MERWIELCKNIHNNLGLLLILNIAVYWAHGQRNQETVWREKEKEREDGIGKMGSQKY